MLGFVAASPVVGGTRNPQAPGLTSRRPRALISMRADSGKGKKAPPLQFAMDMKGKPVWSLRSGTAADVKPLCDLGGEVARLGAEVLEGMIEDCVVCEASVKGTKAGDGFKGKVLGGVVSDVTMSVRDPKVGFESGLVKRAEIMAVETSPALGEAAEDVKRTLVRRCGLLVVCQSRGHDELVVGFC